MTWLKRIVETPRGMLAAGLVLLLVLGAAGFASLSARGDARGMQGVEEDPLPAATADPDMDEDLPEDLDTGTELAGPGARGEDVEPAGGTDPGDGSPAPLTGSDWASPRAPSLVEPVPASARVPKPDAVRGIYVGSWSAGSARRIESLIQLADQTEINAFVVDIKEALGEVSYRTGVPLARQVGADRNPAIADMGALVARLRDHDIYPIARIVVFKDPLLAQARPEWSIRRNDGSLWADDKGVHWVDPFNRDVWDYNIELAREAIALGFSEVQWDYVRFPDVPGSYLRDAVYPAREGQTMATGIREFIVYSRERLADLDVPITADVFGVTTSAQGDVGIGQLWEKLSDVTDVLLPMVYPSHYPRGTWGHPVPNAAPYQVVKRALDAGVRRSEAIPGAATIRPWLQAFTMGQPPYGPREIRAQIQATYDAGLTEWILWSPSVRYPREAFASPDGVEPWLGDLRAPAAVQEPVDAGADVDGRRDAGPLGVPASRRGPPGGPA